MFTLEKYTIALASGYVVGSGGGFSSKRISLYGRPSTHLHTAKYNTTLLILENFVLYCVWIVLERRRCIEELDWSLLTLSALLVTARHTPRQLLR